MERGGVRNRNKDEDVNLSKSKRVFGIGSCCAVKLGAAQVFGAGAGGAEKVGVGFRNANSKMFKLLSVLMFVGSVVSWVWPLIIAGAEGVIEIP